MDTVEPSPRLGLGTLLPDERALVGTHPGRRTALVHEEGRCQHPLGPAVPTVMDKDVDPLRIAKSLWDESHATNGAWARHPVEQT